MLLETVMICKTCNQRADATRRSESCKNLADELYGALKTLVDLKDYKDKHGKDDHYNENQPKAWEDARKILK